MKKKGFRKTLALIVAATMCLALPGIGTYAQAEEPNYEIAPANIIIAATDNCLEWESGNILYCCGGTQVPYGYEAYVKVELQQYDGGWTTIKTWTDRGGSYAIVERNYAVMSGYDYRLKLTHKAYDSNGNLIETIIKYSPIV